MLRLVALCSQFYHKRKPVSVRSRPYRRQSLMFSPDYVSKAPSPSTHRSPPRTRCRDRFRHANRISELHFGIENCHYLLSLVSPDTKFIRPKQPNMTTFMMVGKLDCCSPRYRHPPPRPARFRHRLATICHPFRRNVSNQWAGRERTFQPLASARQVQLFVLIARSPFTSTRTHK